MNYQRPTNLKKEVEAGKGVTLPSAQYNARSSHLSPMPTLRAKGAGVRVYSTLQYTASEGRGGKGKAA
jgi:hypothetical protein